MHDRSRLVANGRTKLNMSHLAISRRHCAWPKAWDARFFSGFHFESLEFDFFFVHVKKTIHKNQNMRCPNCVRCGREGRQHAAGSVLVGVMIALWVGNAKLLQHLHRQGCSSSSNSFSTPWNGSMAPAPSLPVSPPPPISPPCSPPWNKPFAVGLGLKMLHVLGLPPALLVAWCQRRTSQSTAPLVASDRKGSQTGVPVLTPLLTPYSLAATGLLGLAVQGSSVTWVVSLPLTSVSANSALYQTSCVFAYGLSLWLLRERLSCSKSIAVLVALAGVLCITSAKQGAASGSPNSFGGDVLVLGSAALYAFKEVLYKRCFGMSGSRTPLADAALANGLIGAWGAITTPLWLALLDATGCEVFEWPPAELAPGYAVAAAASALFQACLFAAVALTSPTFVALATLLVAPASYLADWASHDYQLPPVALGGTWAVMGAIVVMLRAEWLDARLSRLWRRPWRRCALCPLCRPTRARAAGSVFAAARAADSTGVAVSSTLAEA